MGEVRGAVQRIYIPDVFRGALAPAAFLRHNAVRRKMRLQALRAGAVEFLAKPFDDEVLLENVRAALED